MALGKFLMCECVFSLVVLNGPCDLIAELQKVSIGVRIGGVEVIFNTAVKFAVGLHQ